MKTAEEIRATRAAAKKRYREKKAAAGLVPVTVWIPKETAAEIAGKRRLGIMVAADGTNWGACSGVLDAEGALKFIPE